MECLNTQNNAKQVSSNTNANIGKRRAVGQKPTTLSSANMKKPTAASV